LLLLVVVSVYKEERGSMPWNSGWNRVALCLCILLATTGCWRTPEGIEKRLNESVAGRQQYDTITYSHCHVGEGQWDFICEIHSEPTALGRAHNHDTKSDEVVGVKVTESVWGPGFDEKILSQRWTPIPK
jgi:hypothetical protein